MVGEELGLLEGAEDGSEVGEGVEPLEGVEEGLGLVFTVGVSVGKDASKFSQVHPQFSNPILKSCV